MQAQHGECEISADGSHDPAGAQDQGAGITGEQLLNGIFPGCL